MTRYSSKWLHGSIILAMGLHYGFKMRNIERTHFGICIQSGCQPFCMSKSIFVVITMYGNSVANTKSRMVRRLTESSIIFCLKIMMNQKRTVNQHNSMKQNQYGLCCVDSGRQTILHRNVICTFSLHIYY